jgi:hypothetical protein
MTTPTIQHLLDCLDNDDSDILINMDDLREEMTVFGTDPMDTWQGFVNTMLAHRECDILNAPLVKDIVVNKTVIAVGSGPSLAQHIQSIVNLRDRLFIVAAYSAAPTLRRHGITCDVIVPVERLRDDLDVAYLLRSTIYAGKTVVPDLPQASYERWLNVDCSPMYEYFGVNGPTSSAPLSGLEALRVAVTISGGLHVYSVGNDLCYVDGVSHARDVSLHATQTIDVLCRDGEMRPSRPEWIDGIRWAKREFKSAKIHFLERHGASLGGHPQAREILAYPMQCSSVISYPQQRMPRINKKEYQLNCARLFAQIEDIAENPSSLTAPQYNRLDAIHYIFNPVYLAFSIEKRLNRHPDINQWTERTIAWYCQQMLSVAASKRYRLWM